MPPLFSPIDPPQRLSNHWIKDDKGADISLPSLFASQQKAPIFYLHLWAPNCGSCITEIKKLDALYPRLKSAGLSVILLAEDHNGLVTVPAFMRRHGIKNLVSYIDSSRIIARTLKAPGVPMTYRVTADGTVTSVFEGSMEWEGLIPLGSP